MVGASSRCGNCGCGSSGLWRAVQSGGALGHCMPVQVAAWNHYETLHWAMHVPGRSALTLGHCIDAVQEKQRAKRCRRSGGRHAASHPLLLSALSYHVPKQQAMM